MQCVEKVLKASTDYNKITLKYKRKSTAKNKYKGSLIKLRLKITRQTLYTDINENLISDVLSFLAI